MIVNGKKMAVAQGMTIKDLLTQLEVEESRVVVEIDQVIIAKEDYHQQLSDDQTIEIVSFVGGG